MRKLAATLLLAACTFGVGVGVGRSSRTAGVTPASAVSARNAVPFLGASLAECKPMSLGVDTNTGWDVVEGGYLCNPLFGADDELVTEVEFRQLDGAPMSGEEVDYLLGCSANGFDWLIYPFGGGRWHRSDAGAYADLRGTTNLVVSTEEPYWW